ncbi:MAG: hypothetical protein ACTSRZ_00780 [Promethearchaeota archaeon]
MQNKDEYKSPNANKFNNTYTNEFNDVEDLLNKIKNLPILENVFMILGFGKFGKIALEYALESKRNFIILILDQNLPNNKDLVYLENKLDLKIKLKILRKGDLNSNKLIRTNDTLDFLLNKIKNPIKTNIKEEKTSEFKLKNRIIFYFEQNINQLHEIIIKHIQGIPEFIVPAIPQHIFAVFVVNLIKEYLNNIKISNDLDGTNLASKILSKDVLLKSIPEEGTILLSYAKKNEICPENCFGPEFYCPVFKRKKPQTITEIAFNLKSHPLIVSNGISGFILESHQLKGGLGSIDGYEIKQNLLEMLKIILDLDRGIINTSTKLQKTPIKSHIESKKPKIIMKKMFLATTCNCHGVLYFFFLLFFSSSSL